MRDNVFPLANFIIDCFANSSLYRWELGMDKLNESYTQEL